MSIDFESPVFTGDTVGSDGRFAPYWQRWIARLWQRIQAGLAVQKGGVAKGSQQTLNFIQGAGVTLTIAEDTTNNRINITISAP